MRKIYVFGARGIRSGIFLQSVIPELVQSFEESIRIRKELELNEPIIKKKYEHPFQKFIGKPKF
jgi:hypothetical protein